MSLTNAFNELASQHWVSGTARLAGAVTTVLKLTVGAVIAVTLTQLVGLNPQVAALRPQAGWVELASLVVAAYAFAVLFKANRRDYLWIMAAAMLSYVIARCAGHAWGGPVGVFASAMTLTAAGNLFGRVVHKPGAMIRLPGIIMLVPGASVCVAFDPGAATGCQRGTSGTIGSDQYRDGIDGRIAVRQSADSGAQEFMSRGKCRAIKTPALPAFYWFGSTSLGLPGGALGDGFTRRAFLAVAFFTPPTLLIRKSSTFLPAAVSSASQRGCLPRPVQVSWALAGLRYFGGTLPSLRPARGPGLAAPAGRPGPAVAEAPNNSSME